MDGFKEFEKKLNAISKKAQELDGQHEIPLKELLTDTFIASNTNFKTAQEMFDASGFKVTTNEEFEAIPDNEWDNFIARNTKFTNWEAMLEEAVGAYAIKKLGLD